MPLQIPEISDKKTLYLKLVILAIITLLCIYKTNSLESYPTGDGPEYVLTTEALYRHASPEIRVRDSHSFKRSFTKKNTWEKVHKPGVFDELEAFVAKPGKSFKENFGGLYVAKNQKVYGYHFFAYSLSNVPFRYVIGLLKKNPLACFKYTNAFFIILTCIIILFFSSFNILITSLIAFSYLFSSVYWYIGWTHPEVFTTSLVAIALWLLFNNYNYLPLCIASIAATQNQPLVFLVVLIGCAIIYRLGINYKTVIKCAFCSAIALLPSLFYYYHFGTFNLIKDEGFLDTEYLTFNRFTSFLFDINQGIVIALPLVLFMYIFAFLRKIYLDLKLKNRADFGLFIPLVLTAISLTVITMNNWNHNQAVINRYATWVSVIVFFHFVFLIRDLSAIKTSLIMLFVLFSQIITTLYHETLNKLDWTWNQHKPIAEWVIKNYPALYNPDPTIFGIRTLNSYGIGPEDSPVVYFGESNEICKIMCFKEKLGDLSLYGVSKTDIDILRKKKKDTNGWIYINKGEYKPSKNNEEIFRAINYKTARTVIVPKIKLNTPWYDQVKQKAEQWKVSVDSALIIDALYVLQLERENKNK